MKPTFKPGRPSSTPQGQVQGVRQHYAMAVGAPVNGAKAPKVSQVGGKFQKHK